MLSIKQGDIKYHFLSLCYDSTWDWTQVSRAIGEHSMPMSETIKFKKNRKHNNQMRLKLNCFDEG